jgi:four helix bundle protein
MAFRFENLEIWKLAIDYGEKIHKLIKKFPKSEMFGLSPDLNRAAISISSNIAEGSGSESNREFKRYLRIAINSNFETISQLFVAQRRKYITDKEFCNVYHDGEILVKKITNFKKSLR